MPDDQSLIPKDGDTPNTAQWPAGAESLRPILPYASPNTDAELRSERHEKSARHWSSFCFGVVSAPLSLALLTALAISYGLFAAVAAFACLIVLLLMYVDLRNAALVAGFFIGIGLMCLMVFALCSDRL